MVIDTIQGRWWQSLILLGTSDFSGWQRTTWASFLSPYFLLLVVRFGRSQHLCCPRRFLIFCVLDIIKVKSHYSVCPAKMDMLAKGDRSPIAQILAPILLVLQMCSQSKLCSYHATVSQEFSLESSFTTTTTCSRIQQTPSHVFFSI